MYTLRKFTKKQKQNRRLCVLLPILSNFYVKKKRKKCVEILDRLEMTKITQFDR